MIKIMPTHLATGKCSPKNKIIHKAVKTGRILLNALACVTPTLRNAKQKRINAMTEAKTLRYPTHHNAVCVSTLSIVNRKSQIASGPSLMNQMGIKKQRLIS